MNALVAPRAGAWVEMDIAKAFGVRISVAPRAGAWVEIVNVIGTADGWLQSLPVRERGLKFRVIGNAERKIQSLPVRERGLK